MKLPIIAFFVLHVAVSSAAAAAEMCNRPDLDKVQADHPLCYYYSGTESFRKKNFADAAAKWRMLLDLKDVPLEYEHLRTNAYNNLGFLYFMGQGVMKDRNLAIEYWTHASTLGHEESTYHLCHAYGKAKEPGYDPKKALGYCREALRRYSLAKTEDDSSNAVVIKQLDSYVTRLGGKKRE